MYRVLLLISCFSVLCSTAPAAAQNLLVNPSFELPVLNHTNSWYAGVYGWTVGGLPTYGTTWAHPWNASTPCPDGNQHLWGSANQFYLEQSPVVIRSNTIYTFSVDLYRMEPQGAANSVQVGLVIPGTGYVDVKEFHPTYQPSKEDFVFLTDQWTRVTVQFNSASAPAHVGKNLLATINSYYCAIDNAVFTTSAVAQTIYYISSSSGNDSNNGLSEATAWRSFSNVNVLVLQPGSSVLLKRGDSWNQELNLTGKGTADQPISLGAYGSGNKPRIQRTDVDWHRCVVVNNPSYWRISNLDCRTAKLGIYLRYNFDYFNNDVQISSCDFYDLSSQNVFHPSSNNYEYAWSAAIFLGGQVNTFDPNQVNAPVLTGLLISNCFAHDAGLLFIDNWYWPAVNKRRLRNALITESIASNCFGGLVQLIALPKPVSPVAAPSSPAPIPIHPASLPDSFSHLRIVSSKIANLPIPSAPAPPTTAPAGTSKATPKISISLTTSSMTTPAPPSSLWPPLRTASALTSAAIPSITTAAMPRTVTIITN